MSPVRFKDPQEIARRLGRFADHVRESISRRDKLLERAHAPDVGRSDATDREVRRTLEEALEVVNVQHAELVIAEEELKEQFDELARSLGLLQIERERYRELFDAAPDAYLVTDANGVIREANERAAAMLGVDARYVCGKPLMLYLSNEAVADVRQALLDASRSVMDLRVHVLGRKMNAIAARLRARRIDGGRRILWIAREEESPIATESGDLARALRDKTDLLEREKRERERFEGESRAKDRFLAILSHELRSPLNAVLGWTDLMRRELLDQGRRERALSTIDRNARSLLALVSELLDISRITSDHLQLDVRPLDVGTLVRRAVESVHPSASEKGVVLGCKVEQGCIAIADANRIEQCVRNLLANAFELTPAGASVDVTVAREDGRIVIRVKDSGKGIPAATLPHVFEVFRQGDEPGAKSGLGLYIVRQIVALHGGTTVASSDGEGKGATFTIELPVGDAGPALGEGSVDPTDMGDLTGVRVLVVDDDRDARDLYCTLLGDAGAHVAGASAVARALHLIDTWSPDVIVTDVSMADHDDGLVVARAARDRLGDDVAVVALTGFAGEVDAARSIAASFDAHLGKPVTGPDLIAALVRLRSARGGQKNDPKSGESTPHA